MKKLIVNLGDTEGTLVDMTAEEIAQKETDDQNALAVREQLEAEQTTKDNLKASAKAKLIAGEALTEEEANVLVGV
tara:strand:+ start:261 stop:488 length:228 start_codon:yes stop_codon:yes gene_type:complete